MSGFERELRVARRRQQRLYLLGFAGLLMAAFGMVVALVFANGTVVTILPDEAVAGGRIAIVEGQAVVVGGVVYGVATAPVIAVASPGFRDMRRAIRREEQGGHIVVTLEPLPGRIVATTEPGYDNTSWEIDGSQVGVGRTIDGEVEAGERTLRVDNPWHPVTERRLTVERGAAVELTIDLAPLAGRLELASEPAGASVTVNGRLAGQTPLALEVGGGRYDVAVALDDYLTVEETIELTRVAIAAIRHYRLQPVVATLFVSVEPADGNLLLDGRRIEAQREYEITTDREHRVTYLRDGWRGAKERVRLAPGETRRLALKLERDLGTVEVHSNPAATIRVDGESVGEGSATLSLSAVPHRIELRKEGYRTVTKTVTPTGQRTVVLRETMLPELAARLAEAPRDYRNPAGIELRLFEPQGGFVMGAPRQQEGQRANEFERRTVLGKRFYASRHEITNGQFRMFRAGQGGPDTVPVTGVSWRDAAAFCNWLSTRETLTPFYRIEPDRPVTANATADGYRLLTEAEWEWLARRAGKPHQTVFTWGDESVVPKGAGNIADEAANGLTRYYVPNYSDGHARVAAVGSYPVEASGLFDLTGNVSEWVHDYYSLSPPPVGEVIVDPVGPAFGAAHVVKGSSWRSGTRTTLRAAFRDGLVEGRDDVGFRIGRYLYGAETNEAHGQVGR